MIAMDRNILRGAWTVILAGALAGPALPAEDLAAASAAEALGQDLPAFSLTAAEAYSGSTGSLLPLPDVSGLLGQVPDEEARNIGFKAGIGFTADPTTFLMAMQADFFIIPYVSLGPLMQIGADDDWFIWGNTLNIQAMFDLPMEELRQLKPTFNFGLGFIYMEEDHRRGDDDDWGLLLNWGFGLEYFFMPNFAVGSSMLFNYIPTGAVGEHFFFSWQVIGFRYQF